MYPGQTPNNNQPQPQGQNPQPYYGQPQPGPQYQPNPQPQSPPPYQPNHQQGQPQHQHPSWYQPPAAKKEDLSPSKASDYVSRATTPPIQQGQLVNGQYSVDYLNSMSGTSPNQFSKKFIAIASGAIILTLGLAGALFALTPKQDNSPAATLSTVYTIMADTQEVTKSAGKNIKNSKLRGINSSLDTVLLSTMQSLESPLESSGSKASTLRSAAKKPPIRDEELRQKLEEARLQVMYDRVYLMQMEFKVQEIMRQIEYVYNRTGSETTKQTLEKGHGSLKSIKDSIDGFSQAEDSGII